MKDYYSAEVVSVDFSDPVTVTRVNNWVNTQTKGRIPKIVDAFSDNFAMLLLNAIYFKADWKTKFNKTTTKGDFYLQDGNVAKVAMMKGENIVAKTHYSNDFSFSGI